MSESTQSIEEDGQELFDMAWRSGLNKLFSRHILVIPSYFEVLSHLVLKEFTDNELGKLNITLNERQQEVALKIFSLAVSGGYRLYVVKHIIAEGLSRLGELHP